MPIHELTDRLRHLDSPRVLVVGDCILDRYTIGAVERISPEAPIPVLHVTATEERLGGAFNVAANVAALGGRARVIGVIGDDADGEALLGLARDARLDIDGGIIRDGARPTITKVRMIARQQQMLRVDREDLGPLTDDAAHQLDAAIEDAFAGDEAERPTAVVLSDYGKGVCDAARCRLVIDLARRHDVPVLVDPKGRDYARYRGATVVTPNRLEAEMASAHVFAVLAPSDAEPCARALIEAYELGAVVITLGADGMTLTTREPALADRSFSHWPTEARGVYDVTGAGDTVVGVIALGLAAGWPLALAVPAANHAAGVVVGKLGTAVVTRAELFGALAAAAAHRNRVAAASVACGGGAGEEGGVAEHEREAAYAAAASDPDAVLALAHAKIVDGKDLERVLARHRSAGSDIVFTNGCFDILHAGHLASLAWARRQGDVLIIGLNTDASVARQPKSGNRPLVVERDRALALALLTDVDHVCLFDDDTPASLIAAIRPAVLVKGEDWKGKPVVGAEHAGRVAFAPTVPGLSTTRILERILESHRPPPAAGNQEPGVSA